MLTIIEQQKAFYFSYDMDLTKRLQTIVNEKLATGSVLGVSEYSGISIP